MTQWANEVQEHKVFTTLDQLSRLTSELRDGDLSLDSLDSLERIGEVLNFIRGRLNVAQPSLTPISTLNNLHSNLTNGLNELSSFQSDDNTARLNKAQSHFDNAIRQSLLIPIITTELDVDHLRESIVSYRRSAGQYLRYLEEDVEEIKSQVRHIQEELKAQQSNIEKQKGRLDQAIQNFVDKTSQARERHSEEVSELLSGAREEVSQTLGAVESQFKEAREELGARADQAIESLRDDADEYLSELEERREEAREIVGIIARTGMAGGYEQEADEEKGQADRWRRVAVLSILGIIVMAVLLAWSSVRGEFDIAGFGTKAFASLAFGILAAYAGREAAKHRRREQRNRRLQLELSSIDAYLASLPTDEGNAIKAALADRLFGHPEPVRQQEGEESNVTPPSLMDLIRLFLTERP